MSLIPEISMVGIDFFDKASRLQMEAMSVVKEGLFKMRYTLQNVIKERDNLKASYQEVKREKEHLICQMKTQEMLIQDLTIKCGSSSLCNLNESIRTAIPEQPDCNVTESSHCDDTDDPADVEVKIECSDVAKDNDLDTPIVYIEEEYERNAKSREELIFLDSVPEPGPCLSSTPPSFSSTKSTRNSDLYVCKHCDMVCPTKLKLLMHLKMHVSSKSYKCQHCEKSFLTFSKLRSHNRSHYIDRPQCEQCFARFTRRADLFRHLRIHTGEKPFNCPHCEKSFSRKDRLNVHLRTHCR